ncbi:MAG TPA: CrcB family protein [Mycobacteriales bacterium]
MPLRDPFRVALVAAGGAAGTVLRWRIGLDVRPGAFPTAILVVNVVGSGLLGYLAGRVPVRGPRSEAVRLALGTGVLGGFTTFSTYAVEVARTLDDRPARAVAYALVTVVASVAAAVAGVTVGSINEATR